MFQRKHRQFKQRKNNLPRGKRFLTSYHFFSGIGLGTVFTLHGTFGAPFRFLPSTVPTSVNGRMTKITMLVTATCIEWIKWKIAIKQTNNKVNCQQEGNRALLRSLCCWWLGSQYNHQGRLKKSLADLTPVIHQCTCKWMHYWNIFFSTRVLPQSKVTFLNTHFWFFSCTCSHYCI